MVVLVPSSHPWHDNEDLMEDALAKMQAAFRASAAIAPDRIWDYTDGTLLASANDPRTAQHGFCRGYIRLAGYVDRNQFLIELEPSALEKAAKEFGLEDDPM